MLSIKILRRAFAANLSKVSATRGEQVALEAAGIHEPTLHRYLAWRRSMVVMVVVATVLSAALTTYRALTESDDRSLCSALTERLLEDAEKSLPAVHPFSDPDEDDAADDATAKGKELLKGAKKMLYTAHEEAIANKSRLQDALAQAAGDSAGSEDDEEEPTSAFGKFADGVHLASLYAVPLASLAALYWWTRFRITSRILALGWAFAFFTPMLIALCPWSWWGYVEPEASAKHGLQYYRAMAEGFLEGADYLVTLLPTVLSLIPGVQRACLRVKTLLPESMLPGWFLVAAGPLYAMLLLVIFVAVNQVATHPLSFIGMFLLLAAPLVYVVRANAFTRPLTSDADYRRMRRMQAVVGGMTFVAVVLLVTYLATREFLGIHLIGLDEKTSLLRPIDLLDCLLEFVGRLLFTTVVGADLFMRMNLMAWNDLGLFMRSGRVEDYDRVMQAMARIK